MNYLKNRKDALFVAILVALITLIPYLVGYNTQGEEWRFTGFIIGVEDGNSYIAKMLAGAAGDWLFKSPYSSQYQQGVIAFLPYILLGKLTSGQGQHEQLIALYQMFRILGIFLAVFACYDFISIFIDDRQIRTWALVIIILGGGGGWVLVLLQQKHFLGSLPLEFISPESFGFLGLLGFPHLAVARALLLWGMGSYLVKPKGYFAGLFWLFLGLFQPMVVVIAWAVVGFHSLIIILDLVISKKLSFVDNFSVVKNTFIKPLQAILVSFPIVIYTGIAFLSDPYLIGWASQNWLPSPHIGHYIIAYGLLLPLVYSGLRTLLNNSREQGLLITGWLLILPMLLYAPVNAQRRLVEGAWVIIVVCALAFFLKKAVFNWKWKGYLMLAFPSSLILMIGSIMTASNLTEPVFRPLKEVKMYQFIDKQDLERPVILSSFEIGNNLPAWVPARVVLGHGPESIGNDKIEEDLEVLFSPGTNEIERKYYWDYYQVDYLFWGPIEREQWDWMPQNSGELNQIYNDGDYSIYELIKEDY